MALRFLESAYDGNNIIKFAIPNRTPEWVRDNAGANYVSQLVKEEGFFQIGEYTLLGYPFVVRSSVGYGKGTSNRLTFSTGHYVSSGNDFNQYITPQGSYICIILDDDSKKAYLYAIIEYQATSSSEHGYVIQSTSYNTTADLTTFYNSIIEPPSDIIGTGGGATHIAKVTGQLSALENNLSDILIVAGGGGGGLIREETAYRGSDAGGIAGNGDSSADQTTGYAFGQGEDGAGGGLYGGYKAE